MTLQNQLKQIPQNLQQIQRRIEVACAEAGRSSMEIRLIAVSKLKSADFVNAAADCGQSWFGENYVQELIQKKTMLPDLKWSFIGTVQSNKIDKLATYADEIQTLTSEKHAARFQSALLEKNRKLPVFICVNAGDESTKSGCRFDEIDNLRDYIEERCSQLELQGIMAIPPQLESTERRKLYEKLYQTAQRVGRKHLSLGMSGDLEEAIQQGATVVRIGTDIFGERMKI